MDREEDKKKELLRGCRQEQKQFKISFQQGWPPTGPNCFPKYSVSKQPASEKLHLMQLGHTASAEPQSTCFFSLPSTSVFNPHSADRIALGFMLQVLFACLCQFVFSGIENIFGRVPHFQLYNQPVVIPRLYLRPKWILVNQSKQRKLKFDLLQKSVKKKNTNKTLTFSVCPGIYQIFLQGWQSL